MTDIDDAPAPPALEKTSLFEDFVDIFVSPGAVYARRANSGYFLVLVVVTLVVGWLAFANRGTMQGIMDAEFARGMADAMRKNPGMTQEQLEAGKKFAGYATTFGAFIGVPIAIFVIGLGAWLTGKMLGATLKYSAATMIAAYAFIPRILEAVSVAVQGLLLDTTGFTGRYQLTLGVGRFLEPESMRGMLGLLGRIDLFTLWVTALLAIGIVVVGKLPKDKLIPAGAIMWVYGALPTLYAAVSELMKG